MVFESKVQRKPIWHGLLWLEEHQFVVGAVAWAILATTKKMVHLSKMNPAKIESNPVADKSKIHEAATDDDNCSLSSFPCTT